MQISIQELKKYKYILEENFEFLTELKGFSEQIEFDDKVIVSISQDGLLKVNQGYAWDGVTGWAESDNTIIPSMVHDAMFQLMAKVDSTIPIFKGKKPANQLFMNLMKKNGVPKWKINLFKFAVTVNTPSTKYRQSIRKITFRT